METVKSDTIFTNVALTPDRDVWWEGMDRAPVEGMLDWQGRRWTAASSQSAAHPNSRFTAPMHNNPALSPRAEEDVRPGTASCCV